VTTNKDGTPELSPLIVGKKGGIERILLNVVKNAIDTMSLYPSLRKKIDARIITTGQKIYISILSSGPAIKPDASGKIDHVFKSSSANGATMGLAAVPELLEDLHGYIGAKNQDLASGFGVDFIIVIPKTIEDG
jgi:C4-dicarboxylate-specific signal transduction histidine kinase